MNKHDKVDPGKVDPGVQNVLVVGVGGQGVIMVSKVLARLCQRHGFDVKQSEVHGMAKRGGVVFSHVRFGDKIWSPTIPEGKADVLIGLEWAEALRWLHYLKADSGTFIADTQHIVPPFACLKRHRGAEKRYATETPGEIVSKVARGYAIDATGMATELGNYRVSNTILLGMLSTALDFKVEDWIETLKEMVPPKTIDTNLKAFEAGRAWVLEARSETGQVKTADPVVPLPEMPQQVHYDQKPVMTPEWCKGCNICVRMCPERCLKLNSDLVAELVAPERCTGCRLCEWLCPDFAIDVVRVDGAQDTKTPDRQAETV
jgi:indolepyruvate ferredoxin oxidoreductase beta subunit